MRKNKIYYYSLVFCTMLFVLFQCKEAQLLTPQGELIYQSDCLNTASDSKNNMTKNSAGTDFEIVQYKFKNNILSITHLNTAFNCCPKKITSKIYIEDKRIYIKEAEQESGCHCICLFRIDFEIKELPIDNYILFISSPYIPESGNVLECRINLLEETEGIIKFPRNTYPWN